MIRQLLALLIGIVMGFAGYISLAPHDVSAACCGGPAAQLNPDIYEVAGYPSPALQTLNPLTQKLKAGARVVRFRYQVVSGCIDGNMRATLGQAMADSRDTIGVQFLEDSANPDLTIRANCGVSFNNVCGGGAVIACLGRGWPYVNDIDAVTTMATFYDQSQESIWLHELAGHALATWNEQYQLDGNFSASPGLVDFMNTGELSRYIWPQNDLDRWERTMYALAAPDCSGPTDASWGGTWNPCTGRWENPNGWAFEPATSIWYFKGVPEWGACEPANNDCWNIAAQRWVFRGSLLYNPANGLFSAPPLP